MGKKRLYDQVIFNSVNNGIILYLVNEDPGGTAAKIKRKFWGWRCSDNVYTGAPGDCRAYCCYYVLGIKTGCDEAHLVDCP